MIKTVIQFMKRFHNKFCSFFILIVLPFFVFQKGYAQYLIPDLTFSSGSVSSENYSKIILDEDGNLYHLGIYLNITYIHNNLVPIYGSYNLILSKYDQFGSFLWARTIAYSARNKNIKDIVIHNGEFYLCGSNSDTLIFKNQYNFQNDTLKSVGLNDFFIARLKLNGDLLSYRNYENENIQSIQKIGFIDQNIIFAGYFENFIEFEPLNPTTYSSIYSENKKDIFIACIDTNYNLIWAKRAGGVENDVLKDMIIYDKNIYITGSFVSYMNFNTPSSFNTNTLYSFGYGDMFVARYDRFGVPIWYKRAGSSYDYLNASGSLEFGSDIFANKHGLYIVGTALEYAHFNGPLDTNFIIFDDYYNFDSYAGFFVAHYDLNGGIQYVKDLKMQYHALYFTLIEGSDKYYSICGYLNQNIEEYSTYYQNTLMFNKTQSYDLITRLYDYNGNFITGAKCGGYNFGLINDSKLGKNNLFINGFFGETMNFYDGETAVSQIVSLGSNDFFVTRYPFPDFIIDSVETPNFSLKLFPNPAQSEIFITNSTEQIGLQYVIYDITGKNIFQGELEQNINSINISDFNQGIYFIEVLTPKPTTLKFVKY